MKQRSFRAICLVLMACIAVFKTFGEQQISNLQTVVLESFHQDAEGRWGLRASRFATAESETGQGAFAPELRTVAAFPVAFHGHQPVDIEPQSLGLRGSFSRRGFNWIDIFPLNEEGQATALPIPGQAQSISMWVWGSNLRYNLEAHFRDHTGRMHIIQMGDINHQGWRQMRAAVPARIPQERVMTPRVQLMDFNGDGNSGEFTSELDLVRLEFVKFRIETQPTERVGNFFVYFENFRVVTDMVDSPFDGDWINTRAGIESLWGGQ